MSVRMMSLVWDHLNYGGSELLLGLALADFSDDSGRNIFPSVATLARKTRLSERTVRRHLAEFRAAGWLVLESPGGMVDGRHLAATYRISEVWIRNRGDKLTPRPIGGVAGDREGCHPRPAGVSPVAGRGVTGDSLTIIEPPCEPPYEPPVEQARPVAPELALVPTTQPGPDPIETIFEHWKRVHDHPKAHLDEKRRKLIAARLREYSEADLCQAISGYKNSPFHQGANDRDTVYDDIKLMLRDAGQVDAGLRFYEQPPRMHLSAKTRQVIDQTEGWIPPELRRARHEP